MSTAKKITRIARKEPAKPPRVQFEFELFDGQFVLPSMDAMPLGVVADLNEGDLSVLFDWVLANDGGDDAVEAIRSLTRDEFRDFRKAWGDASGVDPTASTD